MTTYLREFSVVVPLPGQPVTEYHVRQYLQRRYPVARIESIEMVGKDAKVVLRIMMTRIELMVAWLENGRMFCTTEARFR